MTDKVRADAPVLLAGGNPQIAKGHGDAPDEARSIGWVRQASRLPGEKM